MNSLRILPAIVALVGMSGSSHDLPSLLQTRQGQAPESSSSRIWESSFAQCLQTDFLAQTWTNYGETAYGVSIYNGCGSAVWFKACYEGADGKYHKTYGYVGANSVRKDYLLMSGNATPSTFEFNEGSSVDALAYPDPCY